MKKLYDVVVKVGVKSDGKAIWQNVGVVLKGDKGPYMLLNRYFNPAGVPGDSDKGSVLCSLFEPKSDLDFESKSGLKHSFDDSDEILF